MRIDLDLTTEQELRLTEIARRLGLPVRDLAAAAIRDLLARSEANFDRVADRVAEKNADLYRRLS